VSEGSTDSAGVPWAGRTLTSQPFTADDGSAAPALAEALATGDVERVAAALTAARVLVPVVAVLGEGPAPSGPHGRPVDKSADMAVATLVAPDGRRALPVFSSADALAGWDATARPVPAEGPRAALAAVQDGCTALLVDPGSARPVLLPRHALWALAQGRRWVPPERDPQVADAVSAALAGLDAVAGVQLAAAPDAGLAVVLAVRAGLDADELAAVLDAVREGLARAEVLAERVGALTLTVVSA
jgi:hypothetical protein